MSSDKEKVNKILRRLKRNAKNVSNPIKKKKFIESQAKKMQKKMTWPEKEFLKLMKEIKIPVISQKIVCNKIYDFYEPKTNTLIEIDGNYFHGDTNMFENLNSMQKRNKKNDEYKNVIARGLGYNIERIWESDLKEKYFEVRDKMQTLFKI